AGPSNVTRVRAHLQAVTVALSQVDPIEIQVLSEAVLLPMTEHGSPRSLDTIARLVRVWNSSHVLDPSVAERFASAFVHRMDDTVDFEGQEQLAKALG